MRLFDKDSQERPTYDHAKACWHWLTHYFLYKLSFNPEILPGLEKDSKDDSQSEFDSLALASPIPSRSLKGLSLLTIHGFSSMALVTCRTVFPGHFGPIVLSSPLDRTAVKRAGAAFGIDSLVNPQNSARLEDVVQTEPGLRCF